MEYMKHKLGSQQVKIADPGQRNSIIKSVSQNLGHGDMKTRMLAIESRLKQLDVGEQTLSTRFWDLMKSGYSRTMDKINLGKKPCYEQGPVYVGHLGKVYGVHWAGNSEDFVSLSFDGRMLVWNINDLKREPRLNISLRTPWAMTCAFEQERCQLLAAGGLDNICSIFKLPEQFDRTGMASAYSIRVESELMKHEKYVSSVKFIGEERLITGSGDHTCIYWDVATSQPLQVLHGHTSDVMSVSVLPQNDRNVFASAGCDGCVLLWDLRCQEGGAGSMVQTIGKNTATQHSCHNKRAPDMNAVQLFMGGTAVAAAGDDGFIRVFDLRAGSSRTPPESPAQSEIGDSSTPNGKSTAKVRPSEIVANTSRVTPMLDRMVRPSFHLDDDDADSGQTASAENLSLGGGSGPSSPSLSVSSPMGSVGSSSSLSPLRRSIVQRKTSALNRSTTMGGGNVETLNANQRRKKRAAMIDNLDGVPDNSRAPIDRCEFKTFGSVSIDRPALSVAVSRSGRVIYGGYEDGTMRAWDCFSTVNHEEALAQVSRPHVDRITGMNISPDGQKIVTGGWDKSVRLHKVPDTLY
jgi:WD40 repeat protein